jgi:hypothetical protein
MPEWLKKIRDKSQTEKSKNPPLGEFGGRKERPFGEDGHPRDIPDWLKNFKNSNRPNRRTAGTNQ